MATANENVGQAQTPKKSKVFLIILIALSGLEYPNGTMPNYTQKQMMHR